ncbi:MAG TPA: uracil phosphoribosyltransferase, partial [Elusimicrobiales bacterium]|nr:uracil phosphoribosyltransferase [Elusimicrobiales bacterium]
LVAHKLARLRDRRTPAADFRRIMGEVGVLLTCEALYGSRLSEAKVRTPLGPCPARVLAHDIVFVAVLRAGLGMLDGMSRLHPEARLGHIGIYRDEGTLEPVQYYSRLPAKMSGALAVLADPMLATGGSAVKAVDILKSRGAGKVCFVALIGAAAGVERLALAHPDVPIYIGAVDKELNGEGYIVPGLGDAGDRMFGTN